MGDFGKSRRPIGHRHSLGLAMTALAALFHTAAEPGHGFPEVGVVAFAAVLAAPLCTALAGRHPCFASLCTHDQPPLRRAQPPLRAALRA